MRVAPYSLYEERAATARCVFVPLTYWFRTTPHTHACVVQRSNKCCCHISRILHLRLKKHARHCTNNGVYKYVGGATIQVHMCVQRTGKYPGFLWRGYFFFIFKLIKKAIINNSGAKMVSTVLTHSDEPYIFFRLSILRGRRKLHRLGNSLLQRRKAL